MAVGHHRRGRSFPGGRRFLLGFGVTGAGFAAIALAVVVGAGQVGTGQACTSTRHPAALSSVALSPVALSPVALSPVALSPAALSLAALSGPARPAGTVTGIATHYVLDGLPNCSYPNPPADGLFVALSPSEYDSAGACGGYLEVTGPDGSVRVEVIDQCPECATGHIDLSETAFARLAPLSAGLINISYSYLTDPALPGPITMEVKTGSSPYWLALLAGNTGNPLASVQVRSGSGGWISLARASYNYWIASSGAGSGPFTVRLTDTAGNQVTVDDIALSPGTVQSTGSYMYGAGAAPVPPAPSAVASTPAAASPSPSAPSPTTAPSPSPTAVMTTVPASATASAAGSRSASASRSAASAATGRKGTRAAPRAIDPQRAVLASPAPSPSATATCAGG